MAKLPADILANEDFMRKLSVFSLPIVRAVDYFAGATNAMRCDVTFTAANDDEDDGIQQQATAIYAHENLEPCVGECVTAFCCAILSGRVSAGIRFPEEAVSAGDDAAAVLKLASVGAHTTTAVQTRGGRLLTAATSLSREQVWGEKSPSGEYSNNNT